MAAKDAELARLIINLAYRWHKPGRTVRPVGKRADGKGKMWLPSKNPADYEAISDSDLAHYVHPASARSQRRNLEAEARQAIDRGIEKGLIQSVEGKLLPGPWRFSKAAADSDESSITADESAIQPCRSAI